MFSESQNSPVTKFPRSMSVGSSNPFVLPSNGGTRKHFWRRRTPPDEDGQEEATMELEVKENHFPLATLRLVESREANSAASERLRRKSGGLCIHDSLKQWRRARRSSNPCGQVQSSHAAAAQKQSSFVVEVEIEHPASKRKKKV